MSVSLRPSLFMARLAVLLALSFVLAIRPALAQSILRDAETELLFKDMSAPLIRAAGLEPSNVDIVLVGDNSINAFVAGGQAVYVNAGLIMEADNANEVQGVIAHELGHIVGGHVIRFGEGVRPAMGISILSLVLGALATAAGAGDAGMGIMMMGQQAALGKFLSFTRAQESSADAAGARFLEVAGISGKGSLAFFRKLENMEFRYGIAQDNAYDRTHPLSGERVSYLTAAYQASPAWDTPTDPALEERFQRVKAKLKGFSLEPKVALRDYPEKDRSMAGHYARAYAWHRAAYPDKAMMEADALVTAEPNNPWFLELKGQILLESGRPLDAIEPLRLAVELTNNNPLVAVTYGHALIATEDMNNFKEAERVLKAAVARDNDNPFAWYQLGVVYERNGDRPRAMLATAERFSLMGNPRMALPNARGAMAGLPKGSPDYLRAEDIALVSESALEDEKKRRR